MLANENIPEEQTPWAIIMIIAPLAPQEEAEVQPAIIRAMWTTEEYAIITFRSLSLIHTALSMPPPHIEIINTLDNTLEGPSSGLIRRRP